MPNGWEKLLSIESKRIDVNEETEYYALDRLLRKFSLLRYYIDVYLRVLCLGTKMFRNMREEGETFSNTLNEHKEICAV